MNTYLIGFGIYTALTITLGYLVGYRIGRQTTEKDLQELFKALPDETFHPRAIKLIRKRKNFVVVAKDEPYFIKVYGMIRQHEIDKGTWTDEDEQHFKDAFIKRAEEKVEKYEPDTVDGASEF